MTDLATIKDEALNADELDELTDVALEKVSGGGIHFTKVIDKSSQCL